jgi:hypothetical protein
MGFSLPGGQVQSLNSFTYLDKDKNSQTVSSSLYDLQTNNVPAVIIRKAGYSWPTVYENGNAVILNYTVGWTARSLIPKNLTIAVLTVAQFYYNERDLVKSEVSLSANYLDALVWKHKLFNGI